MRKGIKVLFLIGGVGLTSYGVYKVFQTYQLLKAEKDIEEALEVTTEANMILSEQDELEEERKDTFKGYWQDNPEVSVYSVDESRGKFQIVEKKYTRDFAKELESIARVTEEYVENLEKAQEDLELIEERKEKLSVLKHDPNSREAEDQYFNWLFADVWEEIYDRAIRRCRKVRVWNATGNTVDQNVLDLIQEQRLQFFGETFEGGDITLAELILHYARQAAFDLGDNTNQYVGEILENLDIMKTTDVLELERVGSQVSAHTHCIDESPLQGMFRVEIRGSWNDEYWAYVNDDIGEGSEETSMFYVEGDE